MTFIDQLLILTLILDGGIALICFLYLWLSGYISIRGMKTIYDEISGKKYRVPKKWIITEAEVVSVEDILGEDTEGNPKVYKDTPVFQYEVRGKIARISPNKLSGKGKYREGNRVKVAHSKRNALFRLLIPEFKRPSFLAVITPIVLFLVTAAIFAPMYF